MKKKLKEYIRGAKKTKYGCVWYSPVGGIYISNKGEVSRLGSKLPKSNWKG